MRRSPLRRRTPPRRVSRRAAALAPARRALVADVLRTRLRCERPGCECLPTDVHERVTRARGGSVLDPDNVVALCRSCHRWVHDHPAEATALGLLAPSWTR